MPSQDAPSCPEWCDPRVHIDHRGHDTSEHRSAGLSWKPVIADTTLTVRTVQLQSRGSSPLSTGPMIHLHILDAASVNPPGKDIAAGTDLSPEDAEMLAATLVCEAKRVRALRQPDGDSTVIDTPPELSPGR
jgi:hypothetical protein